VNYLKFDSTLSMSQEQLTLNKLQLISVHSSIHFCKNFIDTLAAEPCNLAKQLFDSEKNDFSIFRGLPDNRVSFFGSVMLYS
jgi:hypothetical protein